MRARTHDAMQDPTPEQNNKKYGARRGLTAAVLMLASLPIAAGCGPTGATEGSSSATPTSGETTTEQTAAPAGDAVVNKGDNGGDILSRTRRISLSDNPSYYAGCIADGGGTFAFNSKTGEGDEDWACDTKDISDSYVPRKGSITMEVIKMEDPDRVDCLTIAKSRGWPTVAEIFVNDDGKVAVQRSDVSECILYDFSNN